MAQQKIYLTKEGYQEQLKKYEELKEREKKNIIALQEARAQGVDCCIPKRNRKCFK